MELFGFAVKKVLSLAIQPIGICLALLGVALVFWRGNHRSRLSRGLVWSALVWLVVASLPLTSYFLLLPLETRGGEPAQFEELQRQGVAYILVLGGGGAADWRMVEGIRLWRQLPHTTLILSGGRLGNPERLWRFPVEMGVAREALRIETGLVDTESEAQRLAPLLKRAPFALVTSAYHMPRALRIFRALGLNPIPAPCEFKATESPSLPYCLLPNADALLFTQLALHEYAGMVWLNLKNWFKRGSLP